MKTSISEITKLCDSRLRGRIFTKLLGALFVFTLVASPVNIHPQAMDAPIYVGESHASQNSRFSSESIWPRISRLIGDPGHAGVILLQAGGDGDMFCGGIAGVAAVHAPEVFEVLASADVAETGVGNVHRHEPVRAGKSGRRDNAASSTCLQLMARPRSAGILARAANPRPVKFGHRGPRCFRWSGTG